MSRWSWVGSARTAGKALRAFGFIYFHSVGFLVQKLVAACVWEQVFALPSRYIWRTA